ncbi:MAG: hypothetical protein HYU52_08580 [Acidobacteria bacterium]|nr:hypothetical protein [Acidobacteriota bacterium]
MEDLNDTTAPRDSDPWFLGNAGALSFFAGTSPGTGQELWVTDGSSRGTQLVVDLAPGSASAQIGASAGTAGGSILFNASPGGSAGLWVSDGTAVGTRRLLATKESVSGVGSLHGKAWFIATTAETGRELFHTDGTPQRTVAFDLTPGSDGSAVSWVRFLDESILFFATSPLGSGLHRSDGTAVGTTFVEAGPYPTSAIAIGRRMIFLRRTSGAVSSELWLSDGSSAGTIPIASIPDSSSSPARIRGVLGGKAFLSAIGAQSIQELWVTDGSVSGTHVVAAIDGPPAFGASTSSAFYFFTRAAAPPGGRSLWMTDGTTAGTRLLRTIDGLSSLELVAWGDTIFFAQNDPATGSELWRTDGTQEGTRMVADIAPGSSSSLSFWSVLARADGLLIRATDRKSGNEPWFTDGTAVGTRLVRNVAKDLNRSSRPRNIAVRGETLFFFADDAEGLALCTFSERDGSRRVVSVNRPYGTQDGVVSGDLYYFSQGVLPRVELWRSDGTAEGTFKLRGLTESRYFDQLVPFRGGLLFSADDPEHGLEPWFTDGTVAGTRMIADLAPGSSGSMGYAEMFAASDRYAYLFAANAIWRTDLTQDGTIKLIGGKAEGERFDYGGPFGELAGTVYFINRLHDSAFSLWATDGTPAGTQRVVVIEGHDPPYHLRSSGTRLFFLTQTSGVWSSDGTKDGTLMVSPTRAGWCAFKDAESFATLNGIFYWVSQFESQVGLWRSDGTAAGTYQLSGGPWGSGACGDAAPLVAADDQLYFAGWDAANGFELWRSDGTTEGTGRLADITPGETGSDPRELRLLGSRIYFRAYAPETGIELFSYGLSSPRRRGAHR